MATNANGKLIDSTSNSNHLTVSGSAITTASPVPMPNSVCTSCDPTCPTCSGRGAYACTGCGSNQWLSSSGNCSACTGCSSTQFVYSLCTASTDTVCKACKVCTSTQYVISACGTSDTVCGNCLSTCASCSSASACTTCKQGFYLQTDNTCAPCSTCPTGLCVRVCLGDNLLFPGQFIATQCNKLYPKQTPFANSAPQSALTVRDCVLECLCVVWLTLLADSFMQTPCRSAADAVCTKCSSSCLTCAGKASACTSCSGGQYLSASSCQACSTCTAGMALAALP